MRADPTADVAARAVRSTYRSLRLGVAVLLALLVAAVVLESVRAGCWQGSLSAYYWTGARDVLVGALCGVGALLVAYTGADDVEDALLDVAGLLAFVVAMAPTAPAVACDGTSPVAAVADTVTSLTALVAAATLAVGARTVVALRGAAAPSTVAARLASGAVVVALGAGLLVAPDATVAAAHGTAAVLLFVAVVGVVVLRAFRDRARATRWAAAYAWLGTAMFLALSAVVALHALRPGWDESVLVLETALVGLFAAAWVLQTVELWDDGAGGR